MRLSTAVVCLAAQLGCAHLALAAPSSSSGGESTPSLAARSAPDDRMVVLEQKPVPTVYAFPDSIGHYVPTIYAEPANEVIAPSTTSTANGAETTSASTRGPPPGANTTTGWWPKFSASRIKSYALFGWGPHETSANGYASLIVYAPAHCGACERTQACEAIIDLRCGRGEAPRIWASACALWSSTALPGLRIALCGVYSTLECTHLGSAVIGRMVQD